MGDMAEGFKDMQEASKVRRGNNRTSSIELLKKYKLNYTEHNGGAHIIITHNEQTIDFWAGTGKFKVRGGITSRGIFRLLSYLGIEVN